LSPITSWENSLLKAPTKSAQMMFKHVLPEPGHCCLTQFKRRL